MAAVRLNDVAADAVDAARRDWPNTRFDTYLDGGVVEGSYVAKVSQAMTSKMLTGSFRVCHVHQIPLP